MTIICPSDSAIACLHPACSALALAVLALAGLANLGFWQLRRAEEKQALLTAYEAGQGTSVPLTAVSARILPRYQQVTASGRYESDRQLLLDNMPSKSGAAGFRVMTPFRLDGGDGLVMVDRGWIPVGPDRSVLPGVDVDGSHREIRAMLDELPRPGVRLGAADDSTEPGRRWSTSRSTRSSWRCMASRCCNP